MFEVVALLDEPDSPTEADDADLEPRQGPSTNIASPHTERCTMILSLAHSQIAEATKANMFGAWSDLVTGSRPDGLVDCFLIEADGVVQVAALWESIDAHDRAIGDEATHPALAVFEAMGADATHATFRVVGRLGP